MAPTVSSLRAVSSNSSLFTLDCASTGSPATTVIWTKDGNLLSTYLTYQILRDGVAATYDNFVEIDADLVDLPGTYSCRVLNSAGLSNVATVNIQGKKKHVTCPFSTMFQSLTVHVQVHRSLEMNLLSFWEVEHKSHAHLTLMSLSLSGSMTAVS